MGALNTIQSASQLPELESDYHRDIELGYEPEVDGLLRLVEHGSPSPLIRWHLHDEYELHLVNSTRGRMFVGDYIGNFGPGNLVLAGPRLPHNWITTHYDKGECAPDRDRALIFLDDPIRKACDFIPEMRSILPLLERAKNGIEFFGISDKVSAHLDRLKALQGARRMAVFMELLSDLAQHEHYQLLSSSQMQGCGDVKSQRKVSEIVDYISDNYHQQLYMAEVAERFGMSESRFSRYFRKATGNSFTDFVNRIRVNKACQLLVETDSYISTVCYEVGFNTVANFNRRFMELRGMTPTEFRRSSKLRFLHA